jgi:hypothetical protein
MVDRASARLAARGRRYPAGAHAGAVAGYSDCAALLGLEVEHRSGVGRTRPTAEAKPSGLPGRAFAAQISTQTEPPRLAGRVVELTFLVP